MPLAQFLQEGAASNETVPVFQSLTCSFGRGCPLETGEKSLQPGSSGTKPSPWDWLGLVHRLFETSHVCCKLGELFENCSLH